MTKEPTSAAAFNSTFIFQALWKYKKHLIIITVLSVAASAFFSSDWFIKPKYKSNAIVYPSNLIPYSTESPTEQMLQIFESEDIRKQLIKDFDLMKHYDIDSNQRYPQYYLYLQMDENIKVDKTKFESVEIEVWDTKPEIAKAMVDSIISKFNQKARTVQREKTSEVVIIYKNQLEQKKAEMDSMEMALKNIREKYGIIDVEGQVESFSRAYYFAMTEGKAGNNGNRPIDKVFTNLTTHAGDYIALKEHLWRERGTYNDLKVKYEDVLKDLTKELTYSNIITSPRVAEKKSYPVRSLIVLMFTCSALLVAAIVIIFIENRTRVF
ncbi:MAG TPA: Wzz/FepE/Etk N-terminal domain-containing protein [Bacteroidia bacterium]|nr:Wzz/FepE/Etk N-terminal domain-containing protein [Bacteroidia bacterium]